MMYLRYIQLDLPYIEKAEVIRRVMEENNCTYDEAIKIDYEDNWMVQVRRRFELETRCMADMFIRLLGKYKNKNCSKIVIDCVEKDTEVDYPRYMGDIMGISLVKYELDYREFFSKNNYKKKQMTVQIIKESIYKIGKEAEWDLTSIDETFKKIHELDYNNFWVYGKKVNSLNRLYSAELYIEHEVETIHFHIIIRNKEDKIVRKKLIITEEPSEWVYSQYFGKLIWVSDTEIHLNDKNGFTLFTIYV